VDERRGDDPVVEDRPLPRQQILEEAVQRGHPLDQAGLDLGPLLRGDDAGDEIHREGPFNAPRGLPLLAVHGEGDPLAAERGVAETLTPGEFGGVELSQAINEGAVVRPDLQTVAVLEERLVEPGARVVVVQKLSRHPARRLQPRA
jgi:hypothetical protein